MSKKIIGPVVLVVITLAAVIGYNALFLRGKPTESPLLEHINPVPYLVYFDLEQNKPHAIFETPTLPQYNAYCHKTGKPCQFLPWQQLYSDIMWIGSIQYVGVNLGQNGDKGMYTLFDTLTTLSPYWSYPYAFAQLIIPMQKSVSNSGDVETLALKKKSWENAVAIGLKGESFQCDPVKLAAITGMSEEEFVGSVYSGTTRKPYLNPCKAYEVPHYLAFNYFYFGGDSEHAAEQYRISAFHDNTPTLTPMMAALVFGRGGEHIKSATLWFDRYLALADSDDEINMADANRSLNKAIFETQLQLITDAADATPSCGTSYSCLQKEGAISRSIQKSWNETCKAGKESQNIRCVIMGAGLQAGHITLGGKLRYPLEETGFDFKWSSEFNSWRAQPF